MAKVLVTRRLPGRALERLAADHDVDVWSGPGPPPADELRTRAAGADALLTLLTDTVDAGLFDAAPRLRAIANYAVGTDNVELAAATERGIPVGNTPDVLTEATADLAWALLLAAARRVVEGDRYVRAGEWKTWDPAGLLGRDVHGATLGIIGFGRIGRAVARRAEGFGMEVTHAGGGDGGVALRDLLGRADFVSLHCPLTDDTRGLIDRGAFEAMKPTAILVNTARGAIVDTDALTEALHEGQIAGAALDVTDPEPLPVFHPLLQAPSLTIVPHIGSATHATRERMAEMAVANLLAALRGERMPHPANPEVYERDPATRRAP